ncbi:serine/threonine-protein kinase [Embleya scabrispora]|uniref:serine/threonine-protein kinase n=1 Tax=Embleya scabrispora TaxID=159449 RepID=UPI00037A5C8D|nr:serine/threonine-protein kinase [Embleya scabrispora]MYS84362.1 protein kinase [Streptomyces sp. SID5474]
MAQTGGTRGRIVGGRYRLGTMLGRGGMGTVWRAVDEMLHRDVAIKELRLPDHLDDEEKDLARERTLREARAAARIGHPNVVTIHDVVEEGGIPWIVMELVEAQSLAEILETQGTLTPADAAELGLKVLDALLAADDKGVVHRDVKPANILVTAHGRVVLTDFGIATATGTATLTTTGMLVGSPDFLAPERAEGKRPLLSADLWSLAVVLYMAVEGRNPFRRGTMISTLNAILTDQADPPRHAGGLDAVIAGWLVKDPGLRMGAEEGARILREVADSTPSRQFDAVPPPPSHSPAAPEQPTTPAGAYDPHQHAHPGSDSGAAQHPGGNTPPGAWSQPGYSPAEAGTSATRTASMAGGPPHPPQTPPEPYRPVPEPRRGGTGRIVAVVALVVALIVGGVVVGIVVTRSDGKDDTATTGPSASEKVTTPPPGRSPEPTASTGASALPPAKPPSQGNQGGTTAPTTLPGYVWTKDSAGFSLFVPSGARREVTGAQKDQVDYRTADGKVLIRIGMTKVGGNPLANFRANEGSFKSAYPTYRQVQLKDYAGYRPGWQAAVWEFTWSGDPLATGTKKPAHAMDLGIVTDRSTDYAIYVASYEADWSTAQDAFQKVAAYFKQD